MIEGALRMILGVDFGTRSREVVVVNDGSSDRTKEILKKFGETNNLRIIHREANGGKGAAVRDGISAASGRVIVIQDADLEYDPSQLPSLVKPVLDGTTKVVYGSRFRGVVRNMSVIRRLANRLLTSYINLLFGSRITDACTCYKVIDGEVIRTFHLRSNGFEVCHEITANVLRRGYDITELPISYCARTVDEGVKSSWKDFVRQLGYICAFRLIRSNSAEGASPNSNTT
jgi:glycosyltransferase involved in cell wall biosynthesis